MIPLWVVLDGGRSGRKSEWAKRLRERGKVGNCEESVFLCGGKKRDDMGVVVWG